MGGWTEGAGSRAGSIGALLLGVPDVGGLRYVGKVGTGFTAQERKMLLDLFLRSPKKKSPFVPSSVMKESAPVHFLRPIYVGEVRFSEWTSAGRLRQPSWRGLRNDKDAAKVKIEE